jgi:outer membrane receptor protein involved in Fe transport
VRITVDGIQATMPDGQSTLNHLDAAAVTSAEVLRGPAGALWGNAAGGVITLRTTPLVAPPHGPGIVIDGSKTVFINGLPAARAQDTILEALGPTNKIVRGMFNVFIGD